VRATSRPSRAIDSGWPGYLLSVEPGELDVERFELLLDDGRSALAAGDPAKAANVLRDAVRLWRGPALSDFAYEPFAAGEIGRLEERRLAALEERTDADLAVGRHSDLVGDLETLVAEHPLRERLRAQLMLALYRSRRQAEALEVYQETRHALVERLGIDPSPELQQLGESLGAAAFANRWSSRSSSRISRSSERQREARLRRARLVEASYRARVGAKAQTAGDLLLDRERCECLAELCGRGQVNVKTVNTGRCTRRSP
jgi:DNA-binding SARP family transcriptional activator